MKDSLITAIKKTKHTLKLQVSFPSLRRRTVNKIKIYGTFASVRVTPEMMPYSRFTQKRGSDE